MNVSIWYLQWSVFPSLKEQNIFNVQNLLNNQVDFSKMLAYRCLIKYKVHIIVDDIFAKEI